MGLIFGGCTVCFQHSHEAAPSPRREILTGGDSKNAPRQCNRNSGGVKHMYHQNPDGEIKHGKEELSSAWYLLNMNKDKPFRLPLVNCIVIRARGYRTDKR